MLDICAEDECNDTCGRIRMHQALELKQLDGVKVPSKRTVYQVMEEIDISHRPKRKPNGVTKADKEAGKSDNLIKRNFKFDKPLEKCVTDMTEVKCLDGKPYVSAVFDCFDSEVLGLAMDTNMKSTLCEKHLKTPINHILEFVDVSYTVTGAHSIPVNSIAKQSINMATCKVLTVQVADAMMMHAVKACGQD